MRFINLILGIMMLGFTAVQYNDPDGILWAVYYIIPATLALLAAFRLDILRRANVTRWLWAGVAVWLGLVIFYWPEMPNFWRKEVFMAEETAREGMGLMIAWGVVLIATLTARFKSAASGSALPNQATSQHVPG
jgi:hypothetical protein